MVRKTLTWMLVAGLATAGLPLGAQDYAPDTVWGEVPSWAYSAADAVLTDASGNVVAAVPVVAGRFAFDAVVAGDYYVLLRDAAGSQLARSHPARMTVGAVVKALFGDDRPAAIIPSESSASAGGGGIGKTGLILAGLAGAGVATYFIVRGDDDEGVASGTR